MIDELLYPYMPSLLDPNCATRRKSMKEERSPIVVASSIQNTPNELELMKRCPAELKAKQKNIPKEFVTDRHSLFLKDILEKPLPKKLKILQLTSYEDGNNPVGHLDRYTSWIKLQGASDPIM
ncbi:Uncharacterized protein Adt_39610 [Abeliophyllum distichum]|uniref:Reverse transcriptase n=1 Tax=Abeliophyllum distichum TaxID=126358 RepID=A0ABD1Q8N4_9LAMI